jgi:hypothetical protein
VWFALFRVDAASVNAERHCRPRAGQANFGSDTGIRVPRLGRDLNKICENVTQTTAVMTSNHLEETTQM